MFNKWKEITQDNKVKLILFILGAVLIPVVGYFGKDWFESSSTSPKTLPTSVTITASQGGVIQTNQSGQNVVNIDSGTINIGITPEQYEQGLKRREAEVSTKLKQAHTKDRQVLETELQVIQAKLQNSSTNYEEHVASLKDRIAQLESLRGQLSDEVLDEAKNALAQGDNKKADQLFKQIEEQADSVIKVAAEAAFQRCLIAESDIHYLKALKHCEKAVRLAPDNSLYLNQTGTINDTLANFKKSSAYYEQALASDLKTFGEEHPAVAVDRNNLGFAWASLGEYQKAITYFEQALASDLKTFGKDHPNVAIRWSNLGSTWNSLGENQKAITYFEQALAAFEKKLGKSHPSTQSVKANLTVVRENMTKTETN